MGQAQDWARYVAPYGAIVMEMPKVSKVSFGLSGDSDQICNHSFEGPSYGFLKSEMSVHRLVSCSPFDSLPNVMHTSFTSGEVFTELDDTVKLNS